MTILLDLDTVKIISHNLYSVKIVIEKIYGWGVP